MIYSSYHHYTNYYFTVYFFKVKYVTNYQYNQLKTYPIIIIPIEVTLKKANNNCQFIIFLRIKTLGIDKVTVAVIKAIAVPKGTPLFVRASTIGITLIEFA